MLVLSRKVGETIIIGDDVRFTITRIAGGRVSIGFEAPKETKIVRGELKPLLPRAAVAAVKTVAILVALMLVGCRPLENRPPVAEAAPASPPDPHKPSPKHVTNASVGVFGWANIVEVEVGEHLILVAGIDTSTGSGVSVIHSPNCQCQRAEAIAPTE